MKILLKIIRVYAFGSCLVLAQDSVNYEVKDGDTLWGISKRLNNDPLLWENIYELNKTTIKDPGLIYPRQKLIISTPTFKQNIEAQEAPALSPLNDEVEGSTMDQEKAFESEPEILFSENEALSKLEISRIDVDLGVAVLKLINDDIPSSNLHVGGIFGVDTLFMNTWGLRALARSSLSEISNPLNFKPVWLNSMLQYQVLEKSMLKNVSMTAKVNLGVEYYKNIGQDQSQRFVRSYSGITTGFSLKFEIGESKLYSTGGDFIYTVCLHNI